MTHSSPAARIRCARERLGNTVALLGHHYQHDDVIQHVDLRGDSLELARQIPCLEAQHIVFCGVFFMAESAAILAEPGQHAYIPHTAAHCVMAQMAPAALLDMVYARLTRGGRTLIPLTYVNSSAAIKAFCGRHGGSVCTSANARTMLRWALNQGDGVLFLPDKNLGLNTANQLDIPAGKRTVLDIRARGAVLDLAGADQADLLLWPGCCAIHNRFKAAHVEAARAAHPHATIVVHPECTPDVVDAADVAGSTTTIIRAVAEAPDGATVIVGTEVHLVDRLAAQYNATKTVLPLLRSGCANMAKITEERLADQLDALAGNGPAPEPVTVAPDVATPARLALERMLAACA
ncbi:MAG: quinolinate synthase NadA [Desulfovibrionaceae bacterium]